MQNLTAHYNILFNANELLRQKQLNYETSFIDGYDQFLSVYQDTTSHSLSAPDKELDAAITKANTIISTKEQSHYIGDAYLVLGKANYLYGHYFDAVEFFRYVTLSFPKKKDLVQEARVWQVRSLLRLNQLPAAKLVLDSVMKNINPKKDITGDAYATALQYDINTAAYPDAEIMAKKAVKFSDTKKQRLRWTFILAQLQEINKEPQDAYLNYTSVVKSNASFEMAFNADLNRIRLEDTRARRNLTRMERLRRLLLDEKNIDFIDQIYYQIALLYLANNDIDNAIKNLQLSIRRSTKNQNQKGLSYLRLADINFKNKADFVMAKKYYDSTLLNLSPLYPDYTLIQKKSNNLQVLADRLQLISYEDTLQSLAKLDEKTRATRIDEMVTRHTLQLQAAATVAGPDPFNNAYNNNVGQQTAGAKSASTFYFYNSGAVSQGFSDFKRVWGNRKLEDNWRRSKRSGGDLVVNTTNPAQGTDPDAVPAQATKSADDVTAANYRQSLLRNLPLTPQLLEASNIRVYNAYVDIGNFYRDVLGDKKAAIEAFETIVSRFPADPNKAAIYYNLYRLYSDINPAKADDYKNLILKNYASSIYAKVINDPDYSQRLNDKDAEYTAMYNQIYDLYTKRKYKEVITKADSILNLYPDNKLSAQLSYLRVIANGHKEKVGPFRTELLDITTKYPNDRLMTPLINSHIVYIEENKEKMAEQEFAIMDSAPTAEPFIPATEPVVVSQVSQLPVQKPGQQVIVKQSAPVAKTPPVTTPPPLNNKPATSPTVIPATTIKPPAAPSIFNLRDSTHYYFVINVSSGTTNLSSSRFGIGQFIRANFQGSAIKHQLKNAGPDNQLIYVGRFTNLNNVKDYARAIVPLLPQIMKVPADKYSFFIITQENLDKLADKKLLDSYIDFYQNNY